MIGPITLSRQNIDKFIPPRAIGAYILSRGENIVNYVGRSDIDLNARLKQHLQPGQNIQLWFEIKDSILDAYYLECEWFHKYMPSDNTNHPATPPGALWKCPVVGCPWSI